MQASTPILLLKTASQPTDPYESFLRSSNYATHFLPVLTHIFCDTALSHLASLFSSPDSFLSTYDGIVLTSQRAVEALDTALSILTSSDVIEDIKSLWTRPLRHDSQVLHFFVVGPATHASVSALCSKHFPADVVSIRGQETGTGEALVDFILADGAISKSSASGSSTKNRILFPTGEQRRDTVPRRLTEAGWAVDEVVCYETSTRTQFLDEFDAALRRFNDERVLWVVVFSPQGCREMLSCCGWLGADGTVLEGLREPSGRQRNSKDRSIRVMSIGPTTARFLKEQFAFEVDGVAITPSAEGILKILEKDQQTSSALVDSYAYAYS